MTKTTLGIAAIVASIATLAFVPAAFADTDITIDGNGADSFNKVKVKEFNKTKIEQSNYTEVVTVVNAQSNSGGNKASKNTGGDTGIDTGDATTGVEVSVGGSANVANVENCGCPDDLSIDIKENGADSKNIVKVSNKNLFKFSQYNGTAVFTDVSANTNTGLNKAKKNTGGDTEVKTGESSTGVFVDVSGPINSLN